MKVKSLMDPETSSIMLVFMAFLMNFSWYQTHGNQGDEAVKMIWKTFKNPVNMPWIYSQDFHGFSFHHHKIFQISFTRNSSSLLCYQTKLWGVLDLSQACLALILAQFPQKATRNPHESLANFLHLVKFFVVFLCLCKNLLNTFRKSLPTTFWPRKKVSNLAGRIGE